MTKHTQRPLTLDELAEPVEPGDYDWNEVGVGFYEGLLPDDLLVPYENEWIEANGYRGLRLDGAGSAHVLEAERPGGWPHATPYMENEALRAIVCSQQIAEQLELLIGEPAAVHLNLTGWVTTGRSWHQDTYLNPEFVGDHYAAVWIALDDIHPDSGPFQYIPGSHLWHRLLRERIAPHVDMDDPQWPKHTEDFLTPLVEHEMLRRQTCGVCDGWGFLVDGEGATPFAERATQCGMCGGTGRDIDAPQITTYLPKRGDVLAWHGRLYHQGSQAHVIGAYRPALIAHYSGINHRWDMPPAVQTEHGGWMFPLEGGPV